MHICKENLNFDVSLIGDAVYDQPTNAWFLNQNKSL